jgi:hypothetical protein
MAVASASEASARSVTVMPRSAFTMRPTWSFSARPLPVTACLMTDEEKLRTTAPDCAAASSATPRACPNTSALRTLRE